MRLTIAISLFFTLVSANTLRLRQTQEGGNQAYFTPGSFGTSTTSEDEQLFVDTGRQPNKTSSASFSFAPGNFSSNSDSSTWTWRVNISEVAVPDGNGSQVVNTQWGLHWPGSGSLQSFVERAGLDGGGLCLAVGEIYLPANVTRSYSESDHGNCSSVLGNACAEKFHASWLGGDCGTPASYAFIPECMDTLALGYDDSHTDPGVLINSTTASSIQSGDTVWHQTSARVPADNVTSTFVEAETRLNILMLREIPGVGESATAATMLCQVVDASASSAAVAGINAITMWVLVLAVISSLL